MNPNEFSWTEDQFVTVVNPTDEPYKFMVYSKEYEVGAGETVRMVGYMAWLYVYGLSSQLSQKEGTFNRWNEEGFRQQYYDRLVVGTDEAMQKIEVEPAIEKQTDLEVDESPEEVTEDKPAPKVGRRGRTPKAQ